LKLSARWIVFHLGNADLNKSRAFAINILHDLLEIRSLYRVGVLKTARFHGVREAVGDQIGRFKVSR
jgi:hypothetical protein